MDIYEFAFPLAYSLEWYSTLVSFDIYKDKLNLGFHAIISMSVVGSIVSAIISHVIPKFRHLISLKGFCYIQIILYAVGLTLLKNTSTIEMQIIAKLFCGAGAGILFSCYDLWLCLHVEINKLDYKSINGSALFWNNIIAVFLGITVESTPNLYWLLLISVSAAVYKFENHKFEDFIDGGGSRTPIPLTQNGFYPLLCCQVFFECSIILFVFAWQNIYGLYEGLIGQSKMFSVLMLTSGIASRMSKHLHFGYLRSLMVLSTVLFVLLYLLPSHSLMISTFLIFECTVGMFFPFIGAIREQWSPSTRERYQSMSQVLINMVVAIVVITANIVEFNENQFIVLIVASMCIAAYFSFLVIPNQIKNA